MGYRPTHPRHPSNLKPKPYNVVKCSREEFFYPVERVVTQDIMPKGYLTTSENEYSIVGQIEPGKNKLLYTCSRLYNLVSNEELFAPIEDLLRAEKLNFSVVYNHIGHTKFYADYVLEDYRFTIGKSKDVIKPQFQVQHSYDGGLKFNIDFGVFRLICSNGLRIPMEGMERFAFNVTGKHTKHLDTIIASFKDNLTNFIADWGNNKIRETYRKMTETPVESVANRVAEIVEATDYPKRLVDEAIAIVERERVMLGYKQANEWLVYNGLNESLFSRKSIMHIEDKNAVDDKVLQTMLYANLKARRSKKKDKANR